MKKAFGKIFSVLMAAVTLTATSCDLFNKDTPIV